MKNYDYVYLDKLIVQEALQKYASPRSKLTRLLDAREFLHIRRGLFLAGSETGYSLKTLAPGYGKKVTSLFAAWLAKEQVYA